MGNAPFNLLVNARAIGCLLLGHDPFDLLGGDALGYGFTSHLTGTDPV